jgi:hypothetical protein
VAHTRRVKVTIVNYVLLLIFASILQSTSPSDRTETFIVAPLSVGQPVDDASWTIDPISSLSMCGANDEFLYVDCGVTTESGLKYGIFDGKVFSVEAVSGSSWRLAVGQREIREGDSFLEIVEILQSSRRNDVRVVLEDSSLKLYIQAERGNLSSTILLILDPDRLVVLSATQYVRTI